MQLTVKLETNSNITGWGLNIFIWSGTTWATMAKEKWDVFHSGGGHCHISEFFRTHYEL